jgi:uncharacterized protein
MAENIYIQQIKDKICELDPELILLFGSYAYGVPTEESDIDILVVTNDDFMPKNYDERFTISLKYSKQIFGINQKVPVDLLVYTKPMYQKFIELNSSFSREVLSKGKIIYEKYNQRLA